MVSKTIIKKAFKYKDPPLYLKTLPELGYKDSNLEMTESESVALPFGDSPKTSYL